MPRIDPLQLLNCLQVLLSPTGGILSKNEVHRLASLMTKFSKKLVSKCVYVLILKNTEVTLLGLFMPAGGWTLIHLWLHDAIYTMNWALVKELLELLLITPVDVERLKSNNIPKLVKSLSKKEDLQGVQELSNQLVQQWLKIVKDETQHELASQQKNAQAAAAAVSEETTTDLVVQPEPAQAGEDDVVENEEYDSGINSQTFYKLTLKDGKHLISKVGANETNFQVLENVEVVEMKDEEDVKDKEKKEDKKKSHDKSKHKSSSSKSSSSSSSSRDRDKSSHRDKSKHSSSSKDKDRSRDKHKHDKTKDKDRHRSNGSVSKSNSKSSSSSNSSNSSSSSKDKEKDKKDTKEKQAEKDKDTLSKIQPHTLQKLPKIPKKSFDEKDKSKDGKKDDAKKGTISVEVRKTTEERPKTVKVYKSKMRSTGLEEEAKPAPPRPTKKPVAPVIIPPPPVPPLKRSSPVRDLSAVPPEKKPKLETPVVERPNSIKLIPPKPKPPVLQESDMFMDALTASATTKKEPKKRKRRASVSKDSTGTSPPSSPSSKEAVASLKNLSPPKFYQDTLETEDPKSDSVENVTKTVNENVNEEGDSAVEVPDRIPTPTDTTADDEEEEAPRTRNNNGLKGVLVYVRRKGPKKSIKWKADDELVDIQYFELDETERVNVTKTFGDMAKMDVRGEREALQMSRKLPNEDVMDIHTVWRIPFEIDLPDALAEPGCKSLEKDIQFAREKSVLQSIYFNKKMLPETPAEPDPEMYQVKDPIVIPVDAADNPDHDFRDTPWPEPKGSPPPQNMQNNVSALFPNVQGPFANFPMAAAPNFQNMQNMPNVQPFQGPPFIQQNVMGGGDWNNVNMPNMHNPQIMPRNMPPPEIMNQGLINPNMFIPPQENFNPMMNDNNHRFPPPFNQQGPGPGPGPGPGMFPNNFNRGGFRRGGGGGGGGGGGNGPWLRMNVPAPGNWNMRNGGGPHRGGARMCHHFRNKGFCKNRDNCMFFHPNN